MKPTMLPILWPVLALVAWTYLILGWMAFVRVRAGLRGQIVPGDFRLGESARVPQHVVLANRNYMNLLELPILFYLACVVIAITQVPSGLQVILAWAYVLCRVLHTLIHLSYNHVMHRLAAFSASNAALGVLWVTAQMGMVRLGTGG